jgi:uncharacterized membrane protein (UPF0127 family)
MAAFVRLARPAAALILAMSLAACDGTGTLQASGGQGGDTAKQPDAKEPAKKDPEKKEPEKPKEPERIPVKIAGKTFKVEPALDDATRIRGLSGRTEIPDDGGMIFVFPDIQVRYFVMRDCPVPIDIMFLDGAGRVLVTHAMIPEEPREPNETAFEYEERLKRYASRFPTGIAIELKGGKIKELGLKPGDKVEFDIEGLKKRAR